LLNSLDQLKRRRVPSNFLQYSKGEKVSQQVSKKLSPQPQKKQKVSKAVSFSMGIVAAQAQAINGW